jgi:hypothetical protein
MNNNNCVQSRKMREELPSLEQLDARIVPAAMHAGAAAAAQVAAGASAQAGAVVSDSARGLLRREIRLERRIERRERAVERLEAREARLEARYLARHHRLAAAASNQGIPAASVTPATSGLTGPVTPPASPVSGSLPSSSDPTGSPTVPANPTTLPASPTTPTPVTGPLPANVAAALDGIYEEYENGTLPTTQSGPGQIEIQGSNVGVMMKVNIPDDFATDVADAQALGMQVNATSTSTDIFAGLLPIAELPAVAQLPDAPVIVPIYVPMAR